MHQKPYVLYVIQTKMLKILLSGSQRGCDIVSNINKLFTLNCFSDNGCCPFVFKMCCIKGTFGRRRGEKMTLFTRTRAVNNLEKCFHLPQITQFLVPYRVCATFSLSYFAHIIILMCFSLCFVCAIVN